MNTWIDTHAHLNDERFAHCLDETLDRARSAGVDRILVIGVDRESSERAVELAQSHHELFAVVGIQPNSLAEAEPTDFEAIVRLAESPKVVAVGETGMDRYWDRAPLDLQRESFKRHLELAHDRGLPTVIHCREAEADVVEVLKEFGNQTGSPIRGVMHSFTGTMETAGQCLNLGLHVSFAGMVTYKKNQFLRDIAADLPIDRLLVETDSPYLSPEPFRGKPNEPARVIHTGACLALCRRMTVEAFAQATTANAKRLFGV